MMKRSLTTLALAMMALSANAQNPTPATPASGPVARDAGTGAAAQGVGLTVYNDNYALVRDRRTMSLKQGVNDVEVADVAAQIDPTSVLFRSISNPNSVRILEQNYQYDLITPDNILNKSVGERITFTRFTQDGKAYQDTGILLNPSTAPPVNSPQSGGYYYDQPNPGAGSGLVVKMDDGGVVLRPTGTISIEKMPEGLKPTPVLNWLLESSAAGEQEVEISYTTNGIGWRSDYVVLLNEDDTQLDLAGWVTLDNRSGAAYKDADLTLMAGDVRRVQDQPRYKMEMRREVAMMADAAGAPQFQEKEFFEYHIYKMQRPVTIRQNETKQLSLLNASEVTAQKQLIYDPRGDWFRSYWFPGRPYDPGAGFDTSQNKKLSIVVEVENAEKNNMGMPLPKGKVRVYKLDEDGAQQFVGEDTIDHTPRNEKIRLYLGEAFDVVGEHKRTNYNVISSNAAEESYEVTLRNRKKTPVDVIVAEHAFGDWTVVKQTHQFKKIDASTLHFPVNIPADGEVKIEYTIRMEW